MKEATTIQERPWELRMDKGLSLEELAAAAGISKSALGSDLKVAHNSKSTFIS